MKSRRGEEKGKRVVWMLEVLRIQRNRKLGEGSQETGAGTPGEMGIQNGSGAVSLPGRRGERIRTEGGREARRQGRR